MTHTTLALLLFAATGCSAAKTAMGVLSPKPAQVTVVTNVEPPTVTVTAPAPAVVVVREQPRGRSAMEAVGIVTTSTVAGALLGGVLGKATGHAVAPSTVIGASVGAAAGAVMTRL